MTELQAYIIRNPHLSNKEIGAKFGKSRNAVAQLRRRLKAKGHSVDYRYHKDMPPVGTTVDEDRQTHATKKEQHSLGKKYRVLLTDIEEKEREIEALLALKHAEEWHTITPKAGKDESEAVAVAVLSDTHFEEEVVASTVNYRNSYNLDIAKARCDEFFARVVRLIRKERQDVTINELVLGILGDLITGNIHDSVSMDSCLLGPIDATIFAQELIESGIRHIRERDPDLKVTVVCKFGNHSRTTRFVHIGNEGAYATEKMIYATLAARFRDDPMIEFIIEDSYHTYLDINGYLIRFHHGHFVRYGGGVGGLTIPLNKAIHRWNMDRMADCDVIGHFHQYMPMRRFVVNGSMIGYNTYAVSIGAEPEPPSQSFFLIDKKRGKSVHIPILFSV